MQQSIKIPRTGGQTLAGIIHQPDAGQPRAWALFAHCFTCTKNIRAAVDIADALCDEGIAVVRFDFTGLGQSEGEFADTHFSSNVQDLVDVAEFMAADNHAPQILVGHSLGGTAVLAAAHRIDSAKAVVTIGSPADAKHVLHLIDDDIETIEREGEAKVSLAGRPFHIRSDFVDDVRSQSVRDGIRSLRKALLVMHAPLDELVSIDEASSIYTSAMHPKSFVSLDGADHLLTKRADSRYAGKVLACWASRYIEELKSTPQAARFQSGAVVGIGKAGDGFRVAINADGHRLLADEPAGVGGSDLGPSPYDFLSAGLVGCTVMTLHMYARHKKWALESVEVETRHGKIHAEDCEDCQTKTGKVDRFDRVLKITGDLDETQRQRLLEIADRCPVHRTLHEEVEVRTRLAD
ncbi:MAG TPA: alpha/beta fold hydrolase [Xanthomonadales bacterium]|nr:alpha/beta fold hydrolase [Xanthomonadales bacterium]